MDAYWAGKLASRETIPTEQQVAKAAGYRLTKYAADAVIPAAVELADAHDEAVRAYAEACDFVNARTTEQDRRYPGWERYVTDDVRAVLETRWRLFEGRSSYLPTFGLSFGGGFNRRGPAEKYPLSKWAAWAKAYRHAAKELRKVVERMAAKVA